MIPWIGWGSFTQSTQYAWEFIKGSFLLNQNYDIAAAINLDAQLGNNPQNRSFITGLGYDYPMDPLHHPSQADGIIEPVPGLPVFGCHDYLGYLGYAGATQNPKNLYPRGNQSCSAYPTLRRYYDVFENVAMSEFGVESIARTAVALAYFSSVTAPLNLLPVNFLSIDGEWQNDKIVLEWSVANEENVKGYFIETETGNGFEQVAFVAANNQAQYSLNIYRYHIGNNRFRIRQIDFDGKYTYSQVAIVKVPEIETIMNVYPIPAKDFLLLKWEGATSSCELSLFDMSGRKVLTNSKMQDTPVLKWDISQIPTGMYILQAVYPSGKTSCQKVLID